MTHYLLFLIPVVLLVASCFELYRLTHVNVAYKDNLGQLRGYSFYYRYPWADSWMNIQEWEDKVAEIKKMPAVRIISIKVKSKWRIRRA